MGQGRDCLVHRISVASLAAIAGEVCDVAPDFVARVVPRFDGDVEAHGIEAAEE